MKIKNIIVFQFFLLSMVLLLSMSCRKHDVSEPVKLSTITTDSITDVTQSTAICHATIGSNGGKEVWGNARITASGICWSTKHSPTTSDNKLTSGPMIGKFESHISNLKFFTTYYVRAYATNPAGTAYGNEISFTTTGPLAELTTTKVLNITGTTATVGGNITAYSETVTERGVCWSPKDTPTIADAKKTAPAGVGGTFSVKVTGLKPGVVYKMRAYAANPVGVAYGNTILFLTTPPIVKDYDGNVYHEITIGNQVWMQENLKVTHFRNGDPIPNLPSLPSSYISVYGILYSGIAAVDPRHIAPVGWHVPTKQDWDELITYINGNSGKIKDTITTNWNSPNVQATNETGFTALPGGLSLGGPAGNVGDFSIWWSATPFNATDLYRTSIVSGNTVIASVYANNKAALYFSVRLIKDK